MRALLPVLAALALLCGCSDVATESEPVTVALDFQPNPVHAGIYAAPDDPLTRDAIDIDIVVPSSSTDSLKLLTSGRADLAVVDIHDLGLARERGADVVGVGALVERPLAAVIARPGIDRPRELEGERVGVTGAPSDEAVLRAVVEGDGGDYDRVERTTIGFSAVPSLVAGRVDAVVAFWNAEGVALRQRGLRTREFRLDDYGAPSYPELVLVARREGLTETLASLTGAIAAGNRAALADRPATVARMVELSGADEGLVRAQVAAIAPVLSRDLRLDRRALEAWARFDARYGILRSRPDIRRAFRTGFIGAP
jgi:putative hydroxymethylpyrimidine transport system substrate-binding protein